MLKKILLALIFVITAITNVTHAEDDMKTVASKAYVDTKIETKQLKIPAAGQPNVGAGETVMTYTSTGNGQIGERGLYSDISSYDATTDGDKLITASALNATFTNLPTTPTTKLECANQADGCTLWTIVDQTAYGRELPEGYTRLEYIQSTGTQYINTGVSYGNSEKVVYNADFRVTDFASGGLWGAMSGQRTGTIWLNNNYFRVSIGGTTSSTSSIVIPFDTNRHSVVFDAGLTSNDAVVNLFFDGVLHNASYVYDEVYMGRNRNIMLFDSYGGYSLAKMQVYKFQISLDGVLVFDGIPAKRNSDDVLGMYDTVSGQFFTNQGTGNFVGPAAN